ncbi:hypothetical protein [Spirochaeta africana]|uniref:Uncharacterized protein n=1 Tax=Spirochaeta africana (strain ATCC 700263 / DSM 8902 / Z-7692) TaxID=889378 RepID=H9UJG1_SPIAZ|nr:hypothetical protein [Spirochaeta africana]AFG37654.1 hypothetical protein Spiaf_1596 [Spirochaeta africana DSM 8902]
MKSAEIGWGVGRDEQGRRFCRVCDTSTSPYKAYGTYFHGAGDAMIRVDELKTMLARGQSIKGEERPDFTPYPGDPRPEIAANQSRSGQQLEFCMEGVA